ncbi:MAG: Chromosome partition protein Smc [Mycoplasmataceae bacterium]|nr:MAG: Chromosome partition protein Smc [Mycoplasmataceae bacterium]
MPNAQEYLDQNYLKERRKGIKNLVVRNEGLNGELDLSEFVNLEYLHCSYNQLTKINVSNCKELIMVACSGNKLKSLNLSSCSKLQKLSAFDNKNITDLNLSGCTSLNTIDFRGNKFTDLNSLLKPLNPNKVKHLDFGGYCGNNFSEQDLSCFSRFVNLEVLRIENNNFAGSLEPLKNLTKLKSLHIENNKIDSGLEFLPSGIEDFGHSLDKVRDHLRSKINEKEAELSKKESQIKELESKMKDLEEKEAELKDEVFLVKKKLENIVDHKEKEFLSKKLKELENKLEEAQKELEEKKKEKTLMEFLIKDLKDNVKDLLDQINPLNLIIKEKDNDLNRLRGFEKKSKDLISDLKKAEERKIFLEKQINDWKNKYISLESSTKLLKKELFENQEKNKKEVVNLEHKIEEKEKRILSLTTEKDELVTKTASLQKSLASSLADNEAYQVLYEDSEKQLGKILSELKLTRETREQLILLQKRTKTKRDNLAISRNELKQQLQQDHSNYQSLLEKASQELIDLKQLVKKLQVGLNIEQKKLDEQKKETEKEKIISQELKEKLEFVEQSNENYHQQIIELEDYLEMEEVRKKELESFQEEMIKNLEEDAFLQGKSQGKIEAKEEELRIRGKSDKATKQLREEIRRLKERKNKKEELRVGLEIKIAILKENPRLIEKELEQLIRKTKDKFETESNKWKLLDQVWKNHYSLSSWQKIKSEDFLHVEGTLISLRNKIIQNKLDKDPKELELIIEKSAKLIKFKDILRNAFRKREEKDQKIKERIVNLKEQKKNWKLNLSSLLIIKKKKK